MQWFHVYFSSAMVINLHYWSLQFNDSFLLLLFLLFIFILSIVYVFFFVISSSCILCGHLVLESRPRPISSLKYFYFGASFYLKHIRLTKHTVSLFTLHGHLTGIQQSDGCILLKLGHESTLGSSGFHLHSRVLSREILFISPCK